MRFLSKPLQPIDVACEILRDQFDGDTAIELLVVRRIDLAHRASADSRQQPVRAERLPAQICTGTSQFQHGARAGFQERRAGGVRRQQRVDALPEEGIGPAGRGEKRRSLGSSTASACSNTAFTRCQSSSMFIAG